MTECCKEATSCTPEVRLPYGEGSRVRFGMPHSERTELKLGTRFAKGNDDGGGSSSSFPELRQPTAPHRFCCSNRLGPPATGTNVTAAASGVARADAWDRVHGTQGKTIKEAAMEKLVQTWHAASSSWPSYITINSTSTSANAS